MYTLIRTVFPLLVTLLASAANSAEPAAPNAVTKFDVATFAGGCFWCMEPPFDKLDGVVSTTSGYTGGHKANPTYQEVSAGTTGHAEAVQVRFDPDVVGYETLLEVFWRNIDPTKADSQFCDHGLQYRPAVFVHSEDQQRAAEMSLKEVERNKTFKEPLQVGIEPAGVFYPAEDYHQDYYLKNPLRYRFYRFNCGRDKRLNELWGAKQG